MVSKYNVYDKVWIMYANKPTKMFVFAVIESMTDDKQHTEFYYHLVGELVGTGWGNHEGVRYAEENIFPSKEALIKNLTESW